MYANITHNSKSTIENPNFFVPIEVWLMVTHGKGFERDIEDTVISLWSISCYFKHEMFVVEFLVCMKPTLT